MKSRSILCALAYLTLGMNSWADDSEVMLQLENAGAMVQRDMSLKSRPLLYVRYNLRQVTDAGNQAMKDLETLPAVEFLGSGDTELTSNTLNALRGKSSLKRFAIAYARINDESAKVLGTLKSLDVLELQSQIEMSPNGFNEILKLKQLKELTISDRLVNDAVLEGLISFSNLKALSVHSVLTSDANIATLSQLPNLNSLSIFAGERVTLEGLRQLATIDLKHLDVTYFNVSVAGLKELRKANHLRRLRMVDARKVNDETLPILTEMTDLKELEIVGSRFSKEGAKELKHSLPRCKVTLVDF